MRPFVPLAGVLVCTLTLICAHDARAAAPSAEEEAVRMLIEKNIDGWAKHNPAEVAGTYADDAIWQNPFGVRLVGPAHLQAFLDRLFARPGYLAAKDTSAPAIQAIRLLGPDVAVVWSEESSTGQTENGRPLGDRHSHYLQVVHRTQAGWRITDDMIMDERTIP